MWLKNIKTAASNALIRANSGKATYDKLYIGAHC